MIKKTKTLKSLHTATTCFLLLAFFLMAVLGGSAAPVEAQGSDLVPRRAVITALEGAVLVQAGGQAVALPAHRNMEIKSGDRIITGHNGNCELRYDDGSISRIGPGSRVDITNLSRVGPDGAETTIIHTERGSVWNNARDVVQRNSRFEVNTPFATAGVRGTNFLVRVQRRSDVTTLVRVYQGLVSLYPAPPELPEGLPDDDAPPAPPPPPPEQEIPLSPFQQVSFIPAAPPPEPAPLDVLDVDDFEKDSLVEDQPAAYVEVVTEAKSIMLETAGERLMDELKALAGLAKELELLAQQLAVETDPSRIDQLQTLQQQLQGEFSSRQKVAQSMEQDRQQLALEQEKLSELREVLEQLTPEQLKAEAAGARQQEREQAAQRAERQEQQARQAQAAAQSRQQAGQQAEALGIREALQQAAAQITDDDIRQAAQVLPPPPPGTAPPPVVPPPAPPSPPPPEDYDSAPPPPPPTVSMDEINIMPVEAWQSQPVQVSVVTDATSITASSDNPSVAGVSVDGLEITVNAFEPGNATITVTGTRSGYTSRSRTFVVEVTAVTETRIENISVTNGAIVVGLVHNFPGLTLADFNITATLDGVNHELAVLVYDAATRTISFNPIERLTASQTLAVTVKNAEGSDLLTLSETSQSIEIPGYFFTFDSTTGTITGYDIEGGLAVVIPSTINGVNVTGIGDFAFCIFDEHGHPSGLGITSVEIPDSVTSIGNSAFAYNSLIELTIPNSVITIGTAAFQHNLTLANITIGNNVESIGSWAFERNHLSTITIPDSVTSIGSSAFAYNFILANVTIGNSVQSIGEWAFRHNELTSISIPLSVTSIGARAFMENNLTSITIAGSNVNIEDNLLNDYNNYFRNVYAWGGAGTYKGVQYEYWFPQEYIPIASAEDLDNIRNTAPGTFAAGTGYAGTYTGGLDKKYFQIDDIDLNITPYNTLEGWVPIGTDTDKFTGVFDGNNMLISNLKINRDILYIGLFGHVYDDAELRNINLHDVNIKGHSRVGALAGQISSSSIIKSCSVSGSVEGTGSWVGGLVGYNAGTITNSYATGSVKGSYNVGGLAGYNCSNDSSTRTIQYSYALNSTVTKTDTTHHDIGRVTSKTQGTLTSNYANKNMSLSTSYTVVPDPAGKDGGDLNSFAINEDHNIMLATPTFITAGDNNPTVEILMAGATFNNDESAADLSNWTITTGTTDLSVTNITRNSDFKITISFTGTAKTGTITIQAKAAAISKNADSPQLPLTL